MKNETLRSVIVAAMVVMLTLAGGPAPSARAAGIVVSSTADTTANGDGCTLREAIINANDNAPTWTDCAAGSGADTITFSFNGTIRLGSALPSITDAAGLTINGAGKNVTISGDTNGDGTADVPVLRVDVGATLVVQNLTIAKGNSGIEGGGIDNNHGSVTILNSVVSGNRATYGGAVYQTNGDLIVTNSTFDGNSASIDGGAIFGNGGTITITDSTFSGNSANGGPGWAGAVFNNGGPLVVTGSTFANNLATSIGGGVAVNMGTAIVTNSTFSGNEAGNAGGGIMTNVPLTVTNSTFSGNSAQYGSSVFNGNNSSPVALIRNSILAIGSTGWNCSGWIVNGGNNIETGQTCGFDSNGSMYDTNPLLGTLADNGGPTKTIALQRGSPAINAGNAAICALAKPLGPGGVDQRGKAHMGVCDIGAFEFPSEQMLPLLMR